MVVKSLLKFPPLEEGVLLKRYKRFLADIELANGQIVTAHCANTGPMKGVLYPGGRVRVRYVDSSSRKLSWSWEQAQVISEDGSSCWVGVNTSLPNTLIGLVVKEGLLEEELGVIAGFKKEVTYGREGRSRIDLLLTPASDSQDLRKIFMEVKNTTWVEKECGLFPDTVTKRGQKHLRELMYVLPESRAVLVPCISRSDVKSFAPGDAADQAYGELFREALSSGMEVIPCCFGFHQDHITWEGKCSVLKSQSL